MRNTSLFYFTVILLKVTYRSDGPGVYILKAYYICILCVFMNMTHVTIINNLLTYLLIQITKCFLCQFIG